jgi:hypothetical protein
VQRRKVRTGKEFRLVAQLDEFEIKDIMLDIGYDVNILPKKTWDTLGKPQLTYSPIHLRMANQYFIFPIGRLENVEIDVTGVKTVAYFEVIEIMGDKDPYPALLGIDWDYENSAVIDINKYTMTFEANGIKVVQPLDPYVGPRYTETMKKKMEGEDLDHLYILIIRKRQDYINPIADGSISWRIIQSVDEDSEMAFDNWQQGSYEIFSRRCSTVREIRWVGTEMQMGFQVVKLFNEHSDSKEHIEKCVTQWKVAEIQCRLWVQLFPHSLGPIPKAWFMHEETRRQTND